MDLDMDLSELLRLVGNLNKAPALMQRELRKTAQTGGMLVTGVAIAEAPVDKGILKGMIGPPVTSIGGASVVTKITSHAGYSFFVHEGTAAHVIYPSAKKALFWPGAEHPVRRVNHPGTKANPFMKRALDKTRERLIRLYADMAKRIAERALSA